MQTLSFIAGPLLISLAVSYAWWSKVRVIRIRQDIFDKRDELFDLAVELNGLDDPAYRFARDHLNALAATVESLSLPALFFVAAEMCGDDAPSTTRPRHADPRMDEKIVATMGWCSTRIMRYLLRETASGLILSGPGKVIGYSNAIKTLMTRNAKAWVSSSYPDDLCGSPPSGGRVASVFST